MKHAPPRIVRECDELKASISPTTTLFIGRDMDSIKTEMHIRELNLNSRTQNCLRGAGILYVKDLVEWTVKEIYAIDGLGIDSFFELLNALARHHLVLFKSESQ